MFELTFEIISSASSSPSFTMKIGESIPRFSVDIIFLPIYFFVEVIAGKNTTYVLLR